MTTAHKKIIHLYTKEHFNILKDAGYLNNEIVKILITNVVDGITTLELEKIAEYLLNKFKCQPLFKGFENFPNVACFSVNESIVHGLANDKKLKYGDKVSIDIGLRYNGLCSDLARTVVVGNIKSPHTELLKTAEECFNKGLQKCYPGNTTGDIGATITSVLNKYTKYKVFHKFQGHGIGLNLHEDPPIPNYGKRGCGYRLKEGMCICIEPVLLYKTSKVITYLDDQYKILQFTTSDGLPSAHHENQVFITKDGPVILTM